MGFFDKINKRAADGRQFEEALYAMALQEVTNEDIKPGLWAKAFADSAGNDTRAQAAYLKLRVQSMKDELAAVNRVAGRFRAEWGHDQDTIEPIADGRPSAVDAALREGAYSATGKFPSFLVFGTLIVITIIGLSRIPFGAFVGDNGDSDAHSFTADTSRPAYSGSNTVPATPIEPAPYGVAVFRTNEPQALIPDDTVAIETVSGTLEIADSARAVGGYHLELNSRPLRLWAAQMQFLSISRHDDQDIVLVATQCDEPGCDDVHLAFVRIFRDRRHVIEQRDNFQVSLGLSNQLRELITFRDATTDVDLGLENGQYWFATIGPNEPLTLSSSPVAVEPLSATECKLTTELLNECAELTTPCEDASFRDFLSKCPDAAEPLYRQADDLGTRTTGLNLPAFAHACAKASQLGMTPSAAFVAREICSGADPAQWEKNSVAASATHSADTDTGPSAQ